MNIIAKIRFKGQKTHSYPPYELTRTERGLIWAYIYYEYRKSDMTCLQFEVGRERMIENSWHLRFEPEDLNEYSC